MKIPALVTPRLELRPWGMGDVDRLFAILQEPGILQYFPNPAAPPRVWVEKYIRHHRQHWQERGYGHWALVDRKNGLLAGWVGLEYLPELEQAEIAYLLSGETKGRGFATEAAQAALSYGFMTCGLKEIIGLVHPGNTASIRVLEKCGLKFSDQLALWGLDLLRYRGYETTCLKAPGSSPGQNQAPG